MTSNRVQIKVPDHGFGLRFRIKVPHCSYLDISISPKSSEKKWWFSRFDPGSVQPQKMIFLTNKYGKKGVEWWKESIINTSCEMFIEHSAHFGRLWVVEVSCQVQVNFLKKTIIFLIWKCHFFPLILSLFLPGVVKSTAFYTLWLQFLEVEMSEFQFGRSFTAKCWNDNNASKGSGFDNYW